ncbi:hypothetical protein K432DRAFT_333393 [Lepidopterella palustris CBS 459.81]|uniref:EamA domain-containing protein n=1 Tax=Lepidopterella palustris CBS 459.81 TaxID=1314670 RepID=A0A8E2E5E2_9PEZI|nr:hypothetical protein K432DRAFT_333393 [Lepidopterella palustris CBS 459.81]
MIMDFIRAKPAWLIFAIASGACAAFNGVFAKLTTTELTATWASAISHMLGFGASNTIVEILIRSLFFALNLAFNAIMWGLFTRALTLATSTVRVSIINTSANFMITAVLGALIFSESLPGVWWLGAALLVAGSVIIGRRDKGSETAIEAASEAELLPATDENGYTDRESVKSDREDERRRESLDSESVKGVYDDSDDNDAVLK